MKIMFGTVVYQSGQCYLEEFFKSLSQQTNKEFEIVIINDDMDVNDLNILLKRLGLIATIISGERNSTIVGLRLQLLRYAIQQDFELLIMGDSDDTFSRNRVEKIIDSFDANIAFYYHKIAYMNNNLEFFGELLPERTTSINDIINYNYLGLSNTAINISLSKDALKQLPDKEVIAFDWYLYSFLLVKNCTGKKVENCATNYRIHNQNMAGETKVLFENKLNYGLRVKEKHYEAFMELCDSFRIKYNEMINLKIRLTDEGYCKNYIEVINEKLPNAKFWWENIKSIAEVEELTDDKNWQK